MGRIGQRMPQLFSADIGLIQALFEAVAKVYLWYFVLYIESCFCTILQTCGLNLNLNCGK